MKTLLFSLLFAAISVAQTKPNEYAYTIDKETTYFENGIYKLHVQGRKLPIKYYTEKDSLISKQEFEKLLDHRINIDAYFENDSTVVGKIYARKRFFDISAPGKQALFTYLNKISNNKTDTAAVTMIHFYSGILNNEVQPDMSKINETKYSKHIPNGMIVKHYYIYQKRFAAALKGMGDIWVKDKSGFIENMFIPAHFNYNTTILIMPNNKCYSYFGEHGPKEVSEGIKELLKADIK